MFELLSWEPRTYQLVAVGACIGAFLRVKISGYLVNNFNQNDFSTSLVNILSCFLLGLFFGFNKQCYGSCQEDFNYLFFVTGLLGTLGTFSTFMLEVFDSLVSRKWRKSIELILLSIAGGLFFIYFGILLGSI